MMQTSCIQFLPFFYDKLFDHSIEGYIVLVCMMQLHSLVTSALEPPPDEVVLSNSDETTYRRRRGGLFGTAVCLCMGCREVSWSVLGRITLFL